MLWCKANKREKADTHTAHLFSLSVESARLLFSCNVTQFVILTAHNPHYLLSSPLPL